LELDPARHVPRFTASATPFVLDVALVTALMDDVEARSGRRFAHEFVTRELTEFFLVAGWVVARGHALEDVYEPRLDVAPTVWQRKATADGVGYAVRTAVELRTPVFGVHRLAIACLEAAASRPLTRFRVERGLFASAAEAERFLTDVRADLARFLRGRRRRDIPRRLATAPHRPPCAATDAAAQPSLRAARPLTAHTSTETQRRLSTTLRALVSAARPKTSYASMNSSSPKRWVTNRAESIWRAATSRSSVGVE
jgi:hypothetical protein